MKIIGIIILTVGLGLTFATSLSFFTKEKVIEIGKIEITRNKPHYLTWSPLLGIVLMSIGGIVIWKSSKSQ